MNDVDAKSVERVWRTVEKVGVGMLVTHDGDGLKARPMHSTVQRDEYAIWFIANRHSHKLDEIAEHPDVLLTYSSGTGGDHVTLGGQIELVEDRAKLKELWSAETTIY